LCFIKVNVFAPSNVYSLLPRCMYPRLPSCTCILVFLHVFAYFMLLRCMLKFKRLACGSDDVTQYNTIKHRLHLIRPFEALIFDLTVANNSFVTCSSTRPAMSNPNGLLGQISCRYLNQGRPFSDIVIRGRTLNDLL